MTSRHRVRMVERTFHPFPLRAEAIVPDVHETAEPPLLRREPLSEEPASEGDEPAILDESERLLSAGELYASALSGLESSSGRADRHALTGGPARPTIQLWGAGTSGIPRRGSRAVRLFHNPLEDVFDSVRRGSPPGLTIDTASIGVCSVLGELEMHGTGTLAGAFATRSAAVAVSLRVCRFNAMFTAIEVKLESRRHPRRFFAAAHDALRSLVAPPSSGGWTTTVVG
jgi:hypothetical protein